MTATIERDREVRPFDDQKTTAIIEAAREAFLVRGFDGASMDQIALSAGVSKRTVYNRFRSKEELFGAAIEDSCRKFLPVDTSDIEASLPPRELILALSRQFVAGALTPEALSLRRIAAFEAGRTPAIGRNYIEHGPKFLVEQCTPILNRIVAKGALQIKDPEAAIWRLGALISEPLHTQMLLGDTPADLDAAIDEQVTFGVDAFFLIYGAR